MEGNVVQSERKTRKNAAVNTHQHTEFDKLASAGKLLMEPWQRKPLKFNVQPWQSFRSGNTAKACTWTSIIYCEPIVSVIREG